MGPPGYYFRSCLYNNTRNMGNKQEDLKSESVSNSVTELA